MGRKGKQARRERKKFEKQRLKEQKKYSAFNEDKGKKKMPKFNYSNYNGRVCKYGACKEKTGGAEFCSIAHYEKFIAEKSKELKKEPQTEEAEIIVAFPRIQPKTSHQLYIEGLQRDQEQRKNSVLSKNVSIFDKVVDSIFPKPKWVGEEAKTVIPQKVKTIYWTDYPFDENIHGLPIDQCNLRQVDFVGYENQKKTFLIGFGEGKERKHYSIPQNFLYDAPIRYKDPNRLKHQECFKSYFNIGKPNLSLIA